jgi:hypothetical protein
MNPLSFEFNGKFLAHLAIECFTARHFEFAQPGFHHSPNYLNDINIDRMLSVFDDIPPKTLRSVYHNKGYLSVDHKVQSVSQNEIKFVPRSFVFWDEYFGRFSPQSYLRQREMCGTTFAKSLNLYHMKEANNGVFKKIERNLEKLDQA